MVVHEPIEAFHLITNDFKSIEYDQFVEKVFLNDSVNIKEIVDEYLSSKDGDDDLVLFLLFNLKNRHKQQKKKDADMEAETTAVDDHFANVFVLRSGKDVHILLACSPDCQKKYSKKLNTIKSALKSLFSSKAAVKIGEVYPDKYIDAASVFALAFNRLENFREHLHNNTTMGKRIDWASIDFFAKNNTLVFDKMVVDIGFENIDNVLKDDLEVVFSSLRLVLNRCNDYVLDDDEKLLKLSQVLTNPTFQQEKDDKVDFKKETIHLLTVLKEHGQKSTADADEQLRIFMTDNRLQFQKEIDELQEKLRKSTKAKGCINMVLSKRTELLKDVAKLELRVLDISDMILIIDLFVDRSEHGEASSYIEDAIVLLVNKLTKASLIEEKILNKIFTIVKRTQNEELCCSFVQMLNTIDVADSTSVEEVLAEIVPKMSINKAEMVLSLGGKFRLDDHDSLIAYFYEVLISSQNSGFRKYAFEKLRQVSKKLDECIGQVLKVEESIKNNRSIANECLQLLRNRYRLSLNCFQVLSGQLFDNQTAAIIGEIVDNDVQAIPEDFVVKANTALQTIPDGQAKKECLLNICLALVSSRYMNLKELYSETKFRQIVESDKSLLGVFWKIVTAEHMNNVKLPDEVMEKVKQEASRGNENAANLLNLIERKRSDADIVKNPRVPIAVRIEALERMSPATPVHMKLCMDLIKTEPELKQVAFNTLLRLLPNNYSTVAGYSSIVDLNEIVEHVDLQLNSLISLIQKDKDANLTPLIRPVINKTYFLKGPVEVQIAISLLKLISSLPNGAKYVRDNLDGFLYLALKTDKSAVKSVVLEIIESHGISEDEIKKHIEIKEWQSLTMFNRVMSDTGKSIEERLKAIEDCLSSACLVSADAITSIIHDLANQEHQSFHSRISDILLRVNINQRLSSESIDAAIKVIEGDRGLVKYASIICLLGTFVRAGFEIPDETLEELWKDFVNISGCDKNIAFYSLLTARAIVFQNKAVPVKVILNLKSILAKRDQVMNFRIVCAQIFAKQLKRDLFNSEDTREVLLDVALETVRSTDKEQLLLNTIVFDALKYGIEANVVPLKTLLEFYTGFKTRFVAANQDDWALFQTYLKSAESSTDVEKYHLLSTLNKIYLQQGDINSSIFSKFEAKEWRKEFLCNQLINQLPASENGVDEFELLTFSENVYAVEVKFLRNKDKKLRLDSIEKVIDELIERQHDNQLSLSECNLILLLIESNLDNLRVFDESYEDIFRLAIKAVLLQQKLDEVCVECDDEALERLCDQLPFDLHLINNIFSNTETTKKTSVEEIIEFFSKLDACSLTDEKKINFVKNELVKEKTIQNWLYKLNYFIIRTLIVAKLTDLTQDKSLLTQLYDYLTKLLLNGWSLESIQCLVELIKTEQMLKDLLDSLMVIIEFALKEYESNMSNKSVIDIYKTTASNQWSKQMNSLAVLRTFEGSFDKSIEQLRDEIIELNDASNMSILMNDKFISEYKEVMSVYEKKSLSKWSGDDVKRWAGGVKASKGSGVSQNEKLAVVIRAVELTSGYSPRLVQILSLIIMLNTESSKGRLSQINTGEGKTTIVAMLAVMKALEGHQVDIVTSSTELAKPQSEEQEKFYSTFGLTVSHNGSVASKPIKERYKEDIVYGAAGDFQGDILRDEYSKMGTRSGRKCDVAIVDEVDSMLIDGKNHIVMLSSPMPAMDHLEPLLASIWIQIEQVAKCIKEIDGKVYYVSIDEGIDETGHPVKNLPETLVPIDSTKEEFVKKCTEKHLRKLLRDVDGLTDEEDKQIPSTYPEIRIPKHLREFVCKTQLVKWIESAIHARYRCKLGQHYIIKGTKIAPVDAHNTGVVQANMHWSNGLHQFLQIKHGAKITAESLTTNFISNVTYFRRYGSNIYGLTGTLGSACAQTLLRNTYTVDCVIIPPFRKKQYKELTPVITRTKDEWYRAIVKSSLNKLKNGRGVLIITKYINEVDEISKRLIHDFSYDKSKIKLYKTENDSKVIKEEIKPGEIIIATNIAGRGTDIKAEKIEANGGLHVCITFLPPNERVEQQNAGRTSRTGNKGTGQFIILQNKKIKEEGEEEEEENMFEFECDELTVLKQLRNHVEEENLKEAEKEIEKVTLKDEIFFEFCGLLDEIHDENVTNINIKKRAVEERFGLWLRIKEDNEFKGFEKQQAIELFRTEFRKEILEARSQDDYIKNPYFFIKCGNAYLDVDKKLEAIKEYDRAIDLDDHFVVNAFYNRAFARISHYCGKWKAQNEDDRQQMHEAVKDFTQAKKIIEDNLEPMLNIIQRASSAEAISEQVMHKMTLYSIQKGAIETAIGADVKREIDSLEKQRQQEGLKPEDIETIDKQLQQLRDTKEDREKGVLRKALEKDRDVEIEHVEIEKSLPDDQDIDKYEEELDEYKNNGFRGTFTITEVTPIDWWSVIGLTLLALAQIVGGAALAVFSLGAGSSIGMGLITEGVSDLITVVVDCIINRNFSWESYAIQKAISLTVSLVCAGVGAIKDVAKTAMAGVKAATTIGKTVVTTTVKAGWKLAAKMIGTALAKGIAKHLVTSLVDYGVSKALMPSIYDEVMRRVEEPIQDALVKNGLIKDMLELDGKNRNAYYQSLIKRKALEILNPQNDPAHPMATIVQGIVKGIASQKVKGLGTVLQIAEVIQALNELDSYVPQFIAKLEVAIKEIHQKEDVPTRLRELRESEATTTNQQQQQQTANTDEAQVQVQVMYYAEDDVDIEGDIGGTAEHVPQEQVRLTKEAKSPEDISKHLSASVSTNMCNIIQGKIIAPVTHSGVNYGMDKVTEGVDRQIQDELGDYKAERRIEFFQNKDLDRIPDEFKKGLKDEAAVAKANQLINDVKKGGEAGLPHLGALSDAAGRPIHVYDEKGNLVRTIGGDKNGPPISVEYHKPNAENPSGHWTLPGGNESSFDNTNKNNCLFNVVAQQAGKDPEALRASTAQNMESNKASLANQANDIKRLEMYKKEALTMGGGKKNSKIPQVAKAFKKANISLNSDHNLDDQSNGILAEIAQTTHDLNNKSDEYFRKTSERTKTQGFKITNDTADHRHGLHWMKNDSELEGYFTTDLREDRNNRTHPNGVTNRGNARALFYSPDGSFRGSKFCGVVDTHNSPQVQNLRPWADIPANERSDYVKARNANKVEYGVKKVSTK